MHSPANLWSFPTPTPTFSLYLSCIDVKNNNLVLYIACSSYSHSYNIGLHARKPVFRGLRTTQAQTSLRIPADLSAPLLFAYREVPYLDLLRATF